MGKVQNVVGPQVQGFRSEKDWTQDTFAARCQVRGWDISRGTLSKIEAGLRRVTDAELYFLAKVLGVSVIDLFPKDEIEIQNALRANSEEDLES